MANSTTDSSLGVRLRDTRIFVRAWMRGPLRVGAVVPSSRGLVGLITSEIKVRSAPIIELGPGTGVFTRALLARGIPEDQLTLVECDPGFAHILQVQFPRARVLSMDAARLGTVRLFDGEGAGAVVSGLPFVSMTGRKRMAILEGAFRQMRPSACYYQFTYGPQCPVARPILDRLGLKAKRLGTAFRNIPPATVYRIRRRRTGQIPALGSVTVQKPSQHL